MALLRPHDGDGWSPRGLWTDVKIREAEVGTLFGSFGISLPQIAAQARVEVEPIIGVAKNGLPFIAETGTRSNACGRSSSGARDGSTTGFTVTPSNPILLTETRTTLDRERHNIHFSNASDDVAIRYWGGQQERNRAVQLRYRHPEAASPPVRRRPDPVQIDWLNVYDTGAAPAPRRRRSSDGSRSAPDRLRWPGIPLHRRHGAGATCRVGFTAEVDTGVNDVQGEITVNPVGHRGTRGDRRLRHDGREPESDDRVGHDHRPPEPRGGGESCTPQNYDQVGPTYLKVSWHQLTGRSRATTAPAPGAAAGRSRASRWGLRTSSSSSICPIRSPPRRSSGRV